MTLQKAYELLQDQVDFGGFYNRNAARLILAEVQREHGRAATDKIIRDMNLEKAFGFKPGNEFAPP